MQRYSRLAKLPFDARLSCTWRIEDVSHRLTKSMIAMNDKHKDTHGVIYYRTPTLFDGVPV